MYKIYFINSIWNIFNLLFMFSNILQKTFNYIKLISIILYILYNYFLKTSKFKNN